MACTRGCAGTPICSALDLCCLQLRHDCGKECNGLASGFSSIQINALGELEVCSNVGGICTCVAIGGTDTLVNNDDGTMTHTALDGTVETFCNGIDTILAENDCVEGGIGADYMVREVSLEPVVDGCTQLRVEGAPEHTSLCGSTDSGDFVIYDAPVGVGTITDILPVNLIANNPSLCRDMAVMINFTGYMLFYRSDYAVGNVIQDRVNLEPDLQINGVPAAFAPGSRNAGFFFNELRSDEFIVDFATQGWSGCETIAPGGNLAVDASATLNVVISNNIFEVIPQGCSITVCGSTV